MKTITLKREEILELENIQLKFGLLEEKSKTLIADRQRLMNQLGETYDLPEMGKGWKVDIDKGIMIPPDNKPHVVEDEKIA